MEKRVSARLPEALVVRLEAYAREEDRSVSSVVRIALEQLLSSGAPMAPWPPAVRVVPPVGKPISPVEAVAGVKAGPPVGVQHSSPERVDPKACGHPKGERQVRSWGTICGVCGKRL